MDISSRIRLYVFASEALRAACRATFGSMTALVAGDTAFNPPASGVAVKRCCLSASVEAESFLKLKAKCTEEGVALHSLLCAALYVALAQRRAIDRPPPPFTTERIVRGFIFLLVAIIATLASATGESKTMNYLNSFVGVFAGVLAVHRWTEYPPGFCHVTCESRVWIVADGEGGSTGTGARTDTSTAELSREKRAQSTARVGLAVEGQDTLIEIAKRYHEILGPWVESGKGEELTQLLKDERLGRFNQSHGVGLACCQLLPTEKGEQRGDRKANDDDGMMERVVLQGGAVLYYTAPLPGYKQEPGGGQLELTFMYPDTADAAARALFGAFLVIGHDFLGQAETCGGWKISEIPETER